MPSALPIHPALHELLVHEKRPHVTPNDVSARHGQAPDAALDAAAPKQNAKRALEPAPASTPPTIQRIQSTQAHDADAAADERAAADVARGTGNQQRALDMQQ